MWIAVLLSAAPITCVPDEPSPARYFKIKVVDDRTGRGVPLVELRTVDGARHYTDSAGVVAFYEPGLMDAAVFFHVTSHGYAYPADGFGFRGVRLKTVPGGAAEIRIRRVNLAERLYRVTGGGIYRDSVLVGDAPPIAEPLLNARVFGSDSVVNAVFRGRIYWFWGDTNRPEYPLGNFHVPGATSRLPGDGGLDPDTGVDLEYFTGDDGFARPTARMPGQGPTWIGGLVVVGDGERGERMFAGYVKVKPPLEVYERGIVEFNPETGSFEFRMRFEDGAPLFPAGHPVHHRDGGTEYIYFVQPYPLVRVPATVADLLDPTRYESYTCFTAGSRAPDERLDRDPAGRLRFAWKRDTQPLTPALEKTLADQNKVADHERLFRMTDLESGQTVSVHSSSVYWNDYRRRWVMIALESFGTSPLGEIWYSESPSLTGPWASARKIVTHDRYSFYNPKQHPMFAKDGGRVIYFEATYTTLFSGNPDATPRYNYNQVMYRLDLSDPRLRLAGE